MFMKQTLLNRQGTCLESSGMKKKIGSATKIADHLPKENTWYTKASTDWAKRN